MVILVHDTTSIDGIKTNISLIFKVKRIRLYTEY